MKHLKVKVLLLHVPRTKNWITDLLTRVARRLQGRMDIPQCVRELQMGDPEPWPAEQAEKQFSKSWAGLVLGSM